MISVITFVLMSVTLLHLSSCSYLTLFFFTNPPTTAIYTLSLHDALPIWPGPSSRSGTAPAGPPSTAPQSCIRRTCRRDRKSTRLNSSHLGISYAVFCLKKKNNKKEYRLAGHRYEELLG